MVNTLNTVVSSLYYFKKSEICNRISCIALNDGSREATVLCCTLFVVSIYVLRALPQKHRVCAVLFPRKTEVMFLVPKCFIFKFKIRFVNVKKI